MTADEYREALKAVIDPEIYQNIVDLGLVYDVTVSPDNAVQVTMTYTTPMCPMGPQIKENVEKVLIASGASAAHVQVVFQPQWTPYRMTTELQRTLGILPEEEEEEEEIPLPPPEPQKKGLLSRIFGW
ncbi:MAG: metal-sulfur cluster assembly factor [Caldilineaceae bacterium]